MGKHKKAASAVLITDAMPKDITVKIDGEKIEVRPVVYIETPQNDN